MTHQVERRFVPAEFQTRSVSDGKAVIEGYAYLFNKRSQNLGGFREQILPGAGADSIGRDDIRALNNHEPTLILGRNTAGTLRMTEDTHGLDYEIDVDPRISYVRDLMISLERGDVTQSSFGFESVDDAWSIDEEEFPLRSVRSMKLFDVSPVTYPAYTDSISMVSSRALDRARSMTAVRSLVVSELPAFDAEGLALRALVARHSSRG